MSPGLPRILIRYSQMIHISFAKKPGAPFILLCLLQWQQCLLGDNANTIIHRPIKCIAHYDTLACSQFIFHVAFLEYHGLAKVHAELSTVQSLAVVVALVHLAAKQDIQFRRGGDEDK